MRVRKLDSNGDWTFGKGKSNYAQDQNALNQKIDTRIKSFLGDCFFDITHGIDWFNILGSKDIIAPAISVRSQILNTEGVTRLFELSNEINENRSLSLVYSVYTVYSVTEPLTSEVDLGEVI